VHVAGALNREIEHPFPVERDQRGVPGRALADEATLALPGQADSGTVLIPACGEPASPDPEPTPLLEPQSQSRCRNRASAPHGPTDIPGAAVRWMPPARRWFVSCGCGERSANTNCAPSPVSPVAIRVRSAPMTGAGSGTP
jgi:hypothetical protein